MICTFDAHYDHPNTSWRRMGQGETHIKTRNCPIEEPMFGKISLRSDAVSYLRKNEYTYWFHLKDGSLITTANPAVEPFYQFIISGRAERPAHYLEASILALESRLTQLQSLLPQSKD